MKKLSCQKIYEQESRKFLDEGKNYEEVKVTQFSVKKLWEIMRDARKVINQN